MSWALHPQLAADTHHVASLELSELLLMDNRLHPWLILVPRVPDAVEWIDLPERERHRLLDEVTLAGELLRRLRMPDKLNVAALGNVVAQLHVHVVARFVDDVAWPKPVWGAAPAEPYAADLLARTLGELRSALP
ncbi:MAG: HIT domain-containing protein [Pseudomonadota bacterium]